MACDSCADARWFSKWTFLVFSSLWLAEGSPLTNKNCSSICLICSSNFCSNRLLCGSGPDNNTRIWVCSVQFCFVHRERGPRYFKEQGTRDEGRGTGGWERIPAIPPFSLSSGIQHWLKLLIHWCSLLFSSWSIPLPTGRQAFPHPLKTQTWWVMKIHLVFGVDSPYRLSLITRSQCSRAKDSSNHSFSNLMAFNILGI